VLHLKLTSAFFGLAVFLAASTGAYAFTAGNAVSAERAGTGTAVVSGYDVSSISYTPDSLDPTKLAAVDFTLSADATNVRVQFSDSAGALPASAWVDCARGASTIQHTTPATVHCVLPAIDSRFDKLTVAAS
jgi:hypothetical protein